jgi:hypothetical protein
VQQSLGTDDRDPEADRERAQPDQAPPSGTGRPRGRDARDRELDEADVERDVDRRLDVERARDAQRDDDRRQDRDLDQRPRVSSRVRRRWREIVASAIAEYVWASQKMTAVATSVSRTSAPSGSCSTDHTASTDIATISP